MAEKRESKKTRKTHTDHKTTIKRHKMTEKEMQNNAKRPQSDIKMTKDI